MTGIIRGARVQYSARWLRSVGMLTGLVPFAKGIVTGIEQISNTSRVATVRWNDGDLPARVLASNLSLVGRPEID